MPAVDLLPAVVLWDVISCAAHAAWLRVLCKPQIPLSICVHAYRRSPTLRWRCPKAGGSLALI